MSGKIKAGTKVAVPITINDDDFDSISAIEFLFAQSKNGEALKTAYWSREGESRDCFLIEGTYDIGVIFTRDNTYLFRQNAPFFLDTRIHYSDSEYNPETPIVQLTMNQTLFAKGEEVGP